MSAMTLQPLLQAPLSVQAHVATVMAAFICGVWLIAFSRKGSPSHRAVGAVFMGLMVTTAVIALFIHRRMPHSPVFGLSPTHLLVLFVFFCVWRAYDGVRKGDIKQHRSWATGLFGGALVINGLTNALVFSGITHDIFFKS